MPASWWSSWSSRRLTSPEPAAADTAPPAASSKHRFLPALPSSCAICHAWPAQRICRDCRARFVQHQPRCRTCALTLPADVARHTTQCGACIKDPPALNACWAAVDYAYPWAGLIGEFKFRADPAWAGSFTELLENNTAAVDALQSVDLILPVPLSPHKLRERGFNQAVLLARALQRKMPQSTVDTQSLLRLRDTPEQHTLTRAQRLHNLKTALAVDPERFPLLHSKYVLLVDDVMTTGATLQAAALALRRAGVACISAWVVARTEQR